MTHGERAKLTSVYGEEGAEEAQEGKAGESWEKAVKAISEAREASIQTLIIIARLEEATKRQEPNAVTCDCVAAEVADHMVQLAWAIAAGLDFIKEARDIEYSGDTDRPPAGVVQPSLFSEEDAQASASASPPRTN